MGRSKPPALVKMSELARLSGVPAATIKHYIREGLLPGPARRPSKNMAYYDARLAERVRAIKKLQADSYLPLDVIGDLLEPAPSAALREPAQRIGTLLPAIREGQTIGRQRRGLPTRSMTVAEVLSDLEISARELAALERLGLINPNRSDDSEPTLSDTDLELVLIIHETRARGMGELFSFEILPLYLEKLRALTRFELDLFRRLVMESDRGQDLSLADVGRDATDLGERLVVVLRNRLMVSEIQRLTAETGDEPV